MYIDRSFKNKNRRQARRAAREETEGGWQCESGELLEETG